MLTADGVPLRGAAVDFNFSPGIAAKAPKLQIAASGGVGFEHNHVKRDSLGGKSMIDVANDAGVRLPIDF